MSGGCYDSSHVAISIKQQFAVKMRALDMRTVEDWKAKLPEIIADYDEKDIFNMDEGGIFYRALPSMTLKVKGDNCKGRKKSKDRITAAFCSNLEGDFEKTFIIRQVEDSEMLPKHFRKKSISDVGR